MGKEIWEFRLMANWAWVNGASWQLERPTVSWGAQHPSQLKEGDCPALLWRNLTWSPVSSFGCHNTRSKAIGEYPEEDNQDAEWPQDQDLWGTIEVPRFVQFGEDWGETSSQSATSSRWAMEKELLISLWRPVTGYKEIKIYLNKTWFEEHFCKLTIK